MRAGSSRSGDTRATWLGCRRVLFRRPDTVSVERVIRGLAGAYHGCPSTWIFAWRRPSSRIRKEHSARYPCDLVEPDCTLCSASEIWTGRERPDTARRRRGDPGEALLSTSPWWSNIQVDKSAVASPWNRPRASPGVPAALRLQPDDTAPHRPPMVAPAKTSLSPGVQHQAREQTESIQALMMPATRIAVWRGRPSHKSQTAPAGTSTAKPGPTMSLSVTAAWCTPGSASIRRTPRWAIWSSRKTTSAGSRETTSSAMKTKVASPTTASPAPAQVAGGASRAWATPRRRRGARGAGDRRRPPVRWSR
jgi:hypothetical protein